MKHLFHILIVLLVATAGCASDLSTRHADDSISFEPSLFLKDAPIEFQNEAGTNEAGTNSDAAEINRCTKLKKVSETDSTDAGPINPKKSLIIDLNIPSHQWQGITRDEIREQALSTHPALAQAQANYDALKGKHQQAGLPYNPTAGIIGGDINEAGGAGRYGVFFGREVVRGGKLAASQNVICAELESAGHRMEIIKRRLLTDVDQLYYEVLVAQEQLALAKQLAEISARALETSTELYKAQEVPKTSVLQTRLELRKAQMATRQFEATHLSATRKLAAIIGQERLPTQYVAGSARDLTAIEDFEIAYDNLLRESPELSKMFADIETRKKQLIRQQLEPISNVKWQTSFMYDFVSDDIVGGFQVGWEIPKFDRNQGAIYESSQRVVESQRRLETKALSLRRRLTEAFEKYLDAQIQVQAYDEDILPIAMETAQLLTKGYEVGETSVLELLVSQRALFQTNLSYLQNLRVLWQQTAAIEGMLLDDGLAEQ